MNAVSETEEWDPEDNLPIAVWFQNISARGLKTSVKNLSSCFGGIEKTIN